MVLTTLTFSRLVPRLFHRSVFLFLWLSAVSYCGAQPVYRHVFLDGDRLVCVTDGGDTLAFSARDQGGVTFFDTLNPFKILVFSRPFQKIYYLDHRLSPLSEAISLTDLGLGEVICVCASKYGGFWVYDRWRESLVRFDEQARQVTVSEPFPVLGLGEVQPSSIRESGNRLLLFGSGPKVYAFDLFGGFMGEAVEPQRPGRNLRE